MTWPPESVARGKLKTWVKAERGRAARLARDLGVSAAAVCSWHRYRDRPALRLRAKVFEITGIPVVKHLISSRARDLICAVIVLTYGCSAPSGSVSPAQTIPEPSPGGSAGAPGVPPESSGGAAGQSDPSGPVDVLLAPCGPANCDPDPAGRLGIPNPLGCYQGICTFACAPSWDAAAAECARLGGVCSGDASGIVSCQR